MIRKVMPLLFFVIAGNAKQSHIRLLRGWGLLYRYAPRNDNNNNLI